MKVLIKLSQHGGARQRNWGGAVELRMETRGRAAYGAGGSGLARNDAGLARRARLDREYAQSATRDSRDELAAGRAYRGLGSRGRRAMPLAVSREIYRRVMPS